MAHRNRYFDHFVWINQIGIATPKRARIAVPQLKPAVAISGQALRDTIKRVAGLDHVILGFHAESPADLEKGNTDE